MLFGQDRGRIRQFYHDVWRRHRAGEALEPLEAMVRNVIIDHPEYHGTLADPEPSLQRDYLPEDGEANPFLHMGLHIAIQEQVGTDRPAGIRHLYHRLLAATGDARQVEHRIMDCLTEMIRRAQRDATAPDEAGYLQCLQRLVR